MQRAHTAMLAAIVAISEASRKPDDPQGNKPGEHAVCDSGRSLFSPGHGAAEPNTLFAWWRGFQRWHPSLRLGLLLLIYLVLWAAYLVCRFLPLRIPILLAGGIAAMTIAIPSFSLLDTAMRPPRGVVVETADARLGPGYAYDAAFDRPLPETTEAELLEERDGWTRLRLDGRAECWVRSSSVVREKSRA